MKRIRLSPTLHRVVVALGLVAACHATAQQLIWDGGANGTSQQMRLAVNYVGDTGPTDTSDIYISSTIASVIPTLLVNDVMSVRSFTFDNAAGKFNPTNGLRIAATTNNTASVQGYIFFNTAGTIITALNNANASFRGGSITGSSSADPLPSLTLDLNFSGLGTVDVQDTSIVLIAEGSNNVPGATVVGTGGIHKIGGGTLRLNGNHTYTGGFRLQEGVVEFTSSGSADEGVIANTPFGSGTLTLQGGTLQSTSGTGRTLYNNVHLDGNVAISSDTTGRTGNFTISTNGGSATTLLSNSTLIVAQTVNWNQDISGNASLTKTGAGTLNLNGANTYTGGTTVAEGTLTGTVAHGALSIASGANYDTDGETVSVTTLSGAGTIALTGNTLSAADGSFSGVVSGDGGLTKTGTGTLTLSADNTYTGATTLAGGTLSVAANATGSGALTFTGGTLQHAAGNTADYSARIADSTGAIAIDTNGNNVNYASVLAATNTGGLTKSGAGTLTLANGNAFTGAVAVTGGTLSGDLNGNALSVSSGATYALGGDPRTIAGLSGAGSVTLGIHSLTTDSAANSTFSGVISGTGGLVKQGAGELTLTGANTYSGGTSVHGGTLVVSSSSIQGTILNNANVRFDQAANGTFAGSIAGTGSLTKTGAATLTLTGDNAYSGGTTVSAGTLAGNTTSLKGDITNNAAVTFDQVTDGTYTGNLSGTGTLTKTGAGKLTLAGSSAHTGNTTVSQGTLQVNTVTMVGNLINDALLIWDQLTEDEHTGNISGSGALTKTGAGTLRLLGSNSYTGGTTVSDGALQGHSGSLQGAISNNAIVIFDQASTGTYAGAMSGTGSFIKNGAGALSLTGANTYSGGTAVNAGSLIGNTSSLQGHITANATLVFNQASHGTFNGSLSGAGTLQKLGAGTLTLDGQHSFTGSTHVGAGALRLNAYIDGAMNVAGQGRLTGSGFVGGNTFISGIHAPGDEIGSQMFAGNLTYNQGATIELQFLSIQPPVLSLGDAVPLAGFDQVLVGDDLDFAGAALLSLSFNPAGSTINWNDLMWAEDQTWTIFVANGSISGIDNVTVANASWLDSNGVALRSIYGGAHFSLEVAGNEVLLTYHSAIPEPSTYAALLGTAALALVAYRRRRAATPAA